MRTIIILFLSMMSIVAYSSAKHHLIDNLNNSNQSTQKSQNIDFRQMKKHKPLQVGDERHIEFEIKSTQRAKSKKLTNEEFWVNSFKYEITNGNEVKLAYAYPSSDTLFVPQKVSYNDVEYTVTSVGDGRVSVSNNTNIFKVVLPGSIKRIEAYALYNLTKLELVNLPVNIEFIGESAFEECVSIQNITFPVNLNEIGNYAFYNCLSLNNVNFPASLAKIGVGAFMFCNNITEFIIPAGLTSIGKAAFTDCKNLTGIMVSNSNPNYSSLNGVLYDKHKTKLLAYSNKATNSTSFVIPESVDTIDSRAFANTDIESVVLPLNLRVINTNAFAGCTKLGSVSIPASTIVITGNPFNACSLLTQITVHTNNQNFESVNGLLYTKNRQILKAVPLMFEGSLTVDAATTEIGDRALYYCDKITQLNLPANLQKIGYASIYNCKGLSSIVIPNSITSIDEWAFGWNENLQTVQMSNSLSSLGDCAFYKCPKLTSIQLPNSLTVLNSYTFGENESLTNVQLPTNLKSINRSCFYKCTNLSGILLPSGLTTIGSWAFEQTGLLEVIIPNTVSIIGDGLFYSSTSLKKVILPQNLSSINNYSFYNCISLEDINIPSQLTSINYSAFNGCVKLPGVTLPSTVGSIAPYAFNNCSSLAFVNNLENTSIEAIDNYTFANCKKLHTIKMPNSVKVIRDYAFDGDSLLSEVQLSNQLFSIGDRAFRFCAALKSITLPETLTHIYDRAFLGSGLESINLPKSVEYLGNGVFFRCYGMLNFLVDKDNQRFSDIDGVLFNKDATELIHYPIARVNNSYSLPGTVTGLALGAFYEAENLVNVVLPESLKRINELAFFECRRLKSINLLKVEWVEYGSFAYCIALDSITLSEDLVSAAHYAFEGCSSLKKVAVRNNVTPTIYSTTFNDVPMDICILEVPIGAKQSYQNHAFWGKFSTINEVDFGTSLLLTTRALFQTYPNPATDVFHINLTNKDAAGTISILTTEGKVLLSQATNGRDLVTIQVQHLPKGIYLCRYASQSEIITAKIVKQ